MIARLRHWLDARALDRSLRARKLVRQARAEAARRGISAHWKSAAKQCRAMFGELAR